MRKQTDLLGKDGRIDKNYFDDFVNCSLTQEEALDVEEQPFLIVNSSSPTKTKRLETIWKTAIQCLTTEEFNMMYLHFYADAKQEDIACLFNCSQPYINKVLKNSIKKIKKSLPLEQIEMMLAI